MGHLSFTNVCLIRLLNMKFLLKRKYWPQAWTQDCKWKPLPLIVIKVRISSYKATPGFKIPIQTFAIKSSSSTYLFWSCHMLRLDQFVNYRSKKCTSVAFHLLFALLLFVERVYTIMDRSLNITLANHLLM